MQSEGIGVGGALWVQVLDDLLIPLVSDFARTVSLQVRSHVRAPSLPVMGRPPRLTGGSDASTTSTRCAVGVRPHGIFSILYLLT